MNFVIFELGRGVEGSRTGDRKQARETEEEGQVSWLIGRGGREKKEEEAKEGGA